MQLVAPCHCVQELMSGEDIVDNSMTLNPMASNLKSENGTLSLDANATSTMGSTYKRKKSQLRMGKKIYEFYNAPVTKFWLHTVSFNKRSYLLPHMTYSRLVVIIIIIKNINRPNSYGCELAQHAHMDCTHSLTHLHQ